MANRTEGRMCTSVEKVFRPLPDGLFREVILHFINFFDEDNTISSSKLDNEIMGGLYRLARNDQEQSQYGEVFYTFPEDDEPVRLLCIGKDYRDFRYGRS